MSLRDDDDDTSAGRMTQGGHPDSGAPGPRRRSGASFWWFAIALLVVAVVAVAWLTGAPRKRAPAEAGTVTVSSGICGGGEGCAPGTLTPCRSGRLAA